MKTIYKKDIKAMVKKIWGDDIAGAFDSLTDKEGGGEGEGLPFFCSFLVFWEVTMLLFGKRFGGLGGKEYICGRK